MSRIITFVELYEQLENIRNNRLIDKNEKFRQMNELLDKLPDNMVQRSTKKNSNSFTLLDDTDE